MNLMQIITQNSDLVFKAVGAMMRGESPVDFMKNLAKTHPKFQGYNFDDLEGTANSVCANNNVDIEKMKSEIADFAKSHIK